MFAWLPLFFSNNTLSVIVCCCAIFRFMEVRFEDQRLSQLETDPAFTHGLDQSIVRVFRKRMQLIRAALDERDFYSMKSLHFEKLSGNLQGQNSMRLNAQWRLILRMERSQSGKIVVVISISDYH